MLSLSESPVKIGLILGMWKVDFLLAESGCLLAVLSVAGCLLAVLSESGCFLEFLALWDLPDFPANTRYIRKISDNCMFKVTFLSGVIESGTFIKFI